MVIDYRLKQLREERNFSQGEIEKRTGLLRCYISRVENGHTAPSVDTLEKMARALEIPLYRLFDDDAVAPKALKLASHRTIADDSWGSKGADAKMLKRFKKCLSQVNEKDLRILMFMAQKMASSSGTKTHS
jgi:transcriptional regulator with XRE-family HTH domain